MILKNFSAGHKVHQEAQSARRNFRASRRGRRGFVVVVVTLHLYALCLPQRTLIDSKNFYMSVTNQEFCTRERLLL
jgi:hypothetical protein